MIDFTTNNKRRFVRHPSAIPVELEDRGEAPIICDRLKDIGVGGFCCHSLTKFSKGHLVSIKFPSLSANIRINGQIAWCKKRNPHFEVGIEFQSADDNHAMRMCEQVCQIEAYRKQIFDRAGRLLSDDEAALEWIEHNAEDFPQ